jgi:hypothetical protein
LLSVHLPHALINKTHPLVRDGAKKRQGCPLLITRLNTSTI